MPSPSPERNLAQALQEGRCRDPFSHLGPHQDGAAGDWVIRAFLPGATMVTALADADGAVRAELTDPDGTGLFIGRLASATRPRYRLAVAFGQQHYTLEDPYRFGPWLGDMDVWLLAEGQHLRPWQKLGAHPTTLDGTDGTAFAVWAPHAQRVSVVGDFNGWEGRRHPMRWRVECGVWEIFLPDVAPGARRSG